jgi:hypothetical protein
MTYLLLIYQPHAEREIDAGESGEMLKAYDAYTEHVRRSGAFVDGAPLARTASATTVRVREGHRLITDGPFAETKEWLAGYYLVECDSLDKALELAAACPGAAYGSIEIRPVVDFGGM